MKEFIQSFEGHRVRVEMVKSEPWFVAKDVAERLEYTWKGDAGTMPHVPEEWKGVYSVQTPSGKQDMLCLSEQGLYFFLARSDKPRALPFQKWIAGEVLPALRKTGRFEIPQDERTRAAKIRNTFTETLQVHGCNAPIHFIKITGTMKKHAGIKGNKPKAQFDLMELGKIEAAEIIASINLMQEGADSYESCKPICQDAAERVAIATTQRKAINQGAINA